MGIGAVFSIMTDTILLEKLANLRLVVVVRNIEHLVLDFKRQLLVSPSQLTFIMSEVAVCAFNTALRLNEMSAEGRLEVRVQLLRILLDTIRSIQILFLFIKLLELLWPTRN